LNSFAVLGRRHALATYFPKFRHENALLIKKFRYRFEFSQARLSPRRRRERQALAPRSCRRCCCRP
jgi:hypothetical protein